MFSQWTFENDAENDGQVSVSKPVGLGCGSCFPNFLDQFLQFRQ